ncbi:MAG: extracellular solute-binding protein [Clostridia bacterium]|nr:extracellular solute-binding protein [Clostridia bacterium]MBO7738504.1 extracellular solute-binding protein [Clostridia bacterium]
MKRTICILLVLISLFTMALASCNDASDASKADVSTGPQAYVPHLGDTTAYNGKVLTILSSHETNNYSKEAFSATEITNEPINDASYERNLQLEANYGFTIETVWQDAGGYLARVRDDKAAGIDNYDVMVTGLQMLSTLAAEGFFLDLNSIENSNLHLDQPWWDQPFNDDMSVAGKLYFATGDIVMLDDEYTRCILYNKDIIEDNNLENPAQLVYDHMWTLDALYEMAKVASHEGDGDGKMTVTGGDVWGLVQASFESYTLILGSDCPLVSKDEDDIPRLAMMDARNVEAFEKVWEICTDRETTAYTEQWYSWDASDAYKVCENFQKGQSLFYTITINAVSGKGLREADIRYGILPIPMYDEEQEAYCTTINPYHFHAISIKENCKDIDFVTFALEALAWTGKEYITPEYYERTLKNKRILDDDDSAEMLDIIFSNRIADVSICYNWDDCIQYYNRIFSAGDGGLASLVESEQDQFNFEMEKTLEFFTKD